MNFFEHQEKARKKTAVLFFYFFLAIILIILAIDVIVLGLVLYSDDPNFIAIAANLPQGSQHPISIDLLIKMFINIALFVSPTVITVIVVGSLFRLLSLRAGGIAVAKLADATPIDLNTKIFKEKRFINVVEEMSIASGVAIPKLYVMRNEPSINAFVAGLHPSDTVMVISQGALDELSRDELQGVIGHEYSHIFNSDMQISVKLIGILAGVILIGQIGGFIIRSITRRGQVSSRSRSSSKKGGNGVLIILLLGIGLYLVGYIGLFFGRLIKASISRQRELLADSSSVQFTRNPTGLVGALEKIQRSTVGTHLSTAHAEDISHLCFCPSLSVLCTSLLDTHPPLSFRINQVDPQHIYRNELKSRPLEQTKEEKGQKKENESKTPLTTKTIPFITISALQESIGNPSDAHVELAVSLINNIPNEIRKTCYDPQKVEYLYYALMLPKEPSQYQNGINFIAPPVPKEAIQEIESIFKMLELIDKRSILPVIDISIPAFCQKKPEERHVLFNNLEKLSEFGGKNLFEFTLLGIIGKNADDRKPIDLRAKYNSFDEVSIPLQNLASFIIAASKEKNEDARFNEFIKKLTSKKLKRIPLTELNPLILLPGLKELNLLAPLCKQKLIECCLESIQEDKKITIEEAELIRGVGVCLDCPIPPIIATE